MTTSRPYFNRQENMRHRRLLDKTPSFVWKRFSDGVALRVHLFVPPGHTPDSFAPAVMFFHGGMWMLDYEEEFVSWAMHLANRGIVCLLPQYRTRARFEIEAPDVIQDGLDAWRWLQHNADGLGIDRSRMVLAGSDAGGLMALNAAMPPLAHRPWWKLFGKPAPLPPMPSAVAIFRGVVDVEEAEARTLNVPAEMPDPSVINPCALLRRDLPPLFCAHGMSDPLLDYEIREWFCEEWERLGNKAELVLFPNVDHTLTQFDVNPGEFEQMLLAWEAFMVRCGVWPEPEEELSALME